MSLGVLRKKSKIYPKTPTHPYTNRHSDTISASGKNTETSVRISAVFNLAIIEILYLELASGAGPVICLS
jgi:hypothetical protein